MADEDTTWETPPGEQPGRPGRLTLVAGAAVSVLVLATVGATAGWVLAGSARGGRTSDVAGSVTSTTTPAPTTSAPAGPAIRPATQDPGGGSSSSSSGAADGRAVLPDLVGMDFEQARKELRDRRLGWRLVFGEAGTDRSVASTQPRAGTRVHPGLTVKVLVVGAAPSTPVPRVTGLPCAQAQAQIVDAGFYPEYPRGQNGQVIMQDPKPSTVGRWNDPVRLYCGSAPSGPPHQPGTPTP